MTNRSRGELLALLEEQIGFLRSSAEAFDVGNAGEAKRLAVVARVLLHDTRQSTSLLQQLGVKDQLRFMTTTTGPIPEDTHVVQGNVGQITRRITCPLAPMRISVRDGEKRAYYAPKLGSAGTDRRRPFDEWWTMAIASNLARRLSRQEIVLGLANWDGGAHIDPTLRDGWIQINVPFMDVLVNGEPMEGSNPVLAIMRQVAFELDLTLSDVAPE